MWDADDQERPQLWFVGHVPRGRLTASVFVVLTLLLVLVRGVAGAATVAFTVVARVLALVFGVLRQMQPK